MSFREAFSKFVKNLQSDIIKALENEEPKASFQFDEWKRPGGGGGLTAVIENGEVFEKGGVNVSAVEGELPESMRKHFGVNEANFYATGVSLVIHPKNPFVPTVHANFRYFEMYEDKENQIVKDAWFGGGADLTPYYLFDEDAAHFHQTLKTACDPFDTQHYPMFKDECDAYFRNYHRDEARGVGGLFFDYLKDGTHGHDLEHWHRFTSAVGASFIDAYLPIVQKRKDISYTKANRDWQEIRRGRYVEFNLVHDRGTLFGLKTNGRIESIFMSLPPVVQWKYDFHPEEGTAEAKLLDVLKSPKNWVD